MPKTKYGKELQRIRMLRNELLRDMAKKLGYGPSYLSSIENGANQIPKHFTDLVMKHYDLRDVEIKALKSAEKMTRSRAEELEDLREMVGIKKVKVSEHALKALIAVHRKQEEAFSSAKDFIEAAKHNGMWRAYASLLEDSGEELMKEAKT